MNYTLSVNNVYIRITDERINHIENHHPEMKGQMENIIKTISQPDLIIEGDYDEFLAIKKYHKTPVSNNKYLVAVYKETDNDGFLLTAYFTRKYNQKRNIVWMPSNL